MRQHGRKKQERNIFKRRKTTRRKRQPSTSRVETAVSMPLPQVTVPDHAKRRQRRNKRGQRDTTAVWQLLKQIALSTRWISFFILALSIYAMALAGSNVDYYLTLIPVDGTYSIPPAEIVQASGLAGSHIFAVDPSIAAHEITSLPGVISATVTLEWPNVAHIQIREDSPIAIWQENGVQFWVTENGRLIPARFDTLELLTIEADVPSMAEFLLRSDDGEETTASEVQPSVRFIPEDILAGALQLQTLQPNLTRVQYRPATGLIWQDETHGWDVYLGTGTDMHQKLVIYEAIVQELDARNLTAEYISVKNKEKPYYRAQ